MSDSKNEIFESSKKKVITELNKLTHEQRIKLLREELLKTGFDEAVIMSQPIKTLDNGYYRCCDNNRGDSGGVK